jgi:superfamily II DNA or RNA helicase
MIDLSKHNRATIALNKWKANRGVGTLCHVTGFGKTREGLLLAKQVLTKYPDDYVLITIPSVTVDKVWHNAIENADNDEYLEFTDIQKEHIEIVSVTSLLNDTPTRNYKLLIVDEIHKFTTPERYTIFDKLSYTSILGLTGTYPIGIKKAMLDKYCPIVDTIYEQEALTNGWISEFIEYNIACELTDEDKIRYDKFTVLISETLNLFKGLSKHIIKQDGEPLFKDDYNVIQSCKSGLKTKDVLGKPLYIPAKHIRQTIAIYREWTPTLDITTEFGKERDDYWNPENIKVRVTNFTDFVRHRNDIIINNKVKLNKVLDIINAFPNKTICFNESTDFADDIATALNDNAHRQIATVYHSNITSRPIWDDRLDDYFRYGKSSAKKGQVKLFGKDTLKSVAIQGLIDNTFKVLCTAKALDEGLDIPTIEQVITTAGTANPIQYEQRKGRGLRLDIYNPNKVTKIFNLYFEDFINPRGEITKSRDKQKLIAKQRERSSNVVWITELSEILTP